ncbi:MAG: hypothetical protein H5T63_02385, partial [Chloroflexi bacterium]|nr:hypothetical protein [Chloroflexota bacterium]
MRSRADQTEWGDNSCIARPDFDRVRRKGVPEVILAEHKSTEEALAIARQFLAAEGRAILSRVSEDLEARLRDEFSQEAGLEWYPRARA